MTVTRRLVALSLIVLAGCVDAKIPYPTPRPTRTSPAASVTPVPSVQAMPLASATVAAVPGDPAAGDQIFHTFQPGAGIACMGCHRTDSDERLVGPGLKTVGIRAQTRVPGQSAFQYLHTSIVDPSAYVVEGYPDLMPKNWGRVFTEEQIDDLIAYLMSLSSG